MSLLTPEMIFDCFAIQINGPDAWKESVSIDVDVIDLKTKYRWWLSNGALVYTQVIPENSAEVTLTATSRDLTALVVYGLDDLEKLESHGVLIEGDFGALQRVGGLIDPGNPSFNIVTP
jgi:alkyl sulfatase BDS1-like metallo-beta-lactamase superfamily hydrolase